MRPIVLIGANGQLGSDLVIALKSLRNPLIPLLRRQLDIRNHQNVRRVLAQYDPEFIVNDQYRRASRLGIGACLHPSPTIICSH